MPADIVSFQLKPVGFFGRNPALALPSSPGRTNGTFHVKCPIRRPSEGTYHVKCPGGGSTAGSAGCRVQGLADILRR